MKRMPMLHLVLLITILCVAPARAQVVMHGDADLWVYGSRVRVEVEDITNFNDVNTDRLRWRLWASDDEWELYDRGRVIAKAAVPKLRARQNHSHVRRTMHLDRPSSGWYYLTLTLEERTYDDSGKVRWEIRDRIEFDGRFYLRKHTFWPPFPF